MLSTGAFNAFLKTLEEPPPHVKFIFATTESHKVPITIRSRCQRYDFRLIPQAVIADRVRHILSAEEIQADDETVGIVAREAAGSMRDALTLLDQIVAFGGSELRGDEVATTLGIANRSVVRDVCRAVLEGDGRAVLTGVDQLATQGLDILHFSKQVLDYFRDLVVLRVSEGDHGLVSLVDEELTAARELANAHDPLELNRAFSSLSLLVEDVGRSGTPKIVLEMGLVRLATRPPLRQVGELVARLEALERRLADPGGGNPSPTPRSSRGGAPPDRSRGSSGARGQSPPASPSSAQSPPPSSQAPTPAAQPSQAHPSEPAAPAQASPAPPPQPDVPEPSAAPAETAADASPPPERPSAVVDVPLSEQSTMAAWERILNRVRDSRPALAAILEHGAPKSIEPTQIVVAFPPGSFFGNQAGERDSREGLAICAEQVIGAKPKIEIVYSADSDGRGRTLAEVDDRRREDQREQTRREALNHPTVVDAIQVFDVAPNAVKVQVD